MYWLLIFWVLFLIVYLGINIYGLMRVSALRLKGDITPLMILVYLIVMFIIIVGTVAIISSLDWGEGLRDYIKFF